jgi:hypothetical protein
VKYTPSGGVIRAELARHPGGITLTVTDNGPGIPEPERPLVTRRFHRGDQSRATPGLGIGLGMVEAISLQLHLFDKQLPFAAQPPGGVLGQQGQLGGRIRQAATNAHHQAIERGLNQGLGRRHGRPARQG